DIAITNGNKLFGIISDLLDFQKADIANSPMRMIETNVNFMLQGVRDKFYVMAQDKHISIGITECPDNITVSTDYELMTKLFDNLLSNAIKYTNEGHVKLMIHMISLYEDVVEMSFRVVDTGIGIKDEDQKRLFDSFARLDEHTNRNIEGTGLGMSIVSELLGMMGTSIKVESIYGKGSVFSFRLRQRVVDAAPMGGIEDQDHKEVAGSSRRGVTFKAPKARILVADDNKINLKVAKGFLELMDIEPELVESGSETIERVRAKEYDIIFLDHMMPEMDGIETLSMMKRAGILPDHTAVIALTANAGNGVREQYIDAGFDDYLAKPMNISELSEKLEKYLPPEICMSAYGSDNN
ncbi:MAG: response regulator, partial [Lachnospiraceae bacterium]|nr:response regulator [Lachnospiraceae bacterium]